MGAFAVPSVSDEVVLSASCLASSIKPVVGPGCFVAEPPSPRSSSALPDSPTFSFISRSFFSFFHVSYSALSSFFQTSKSAFSFLQASNSALSFSFASSFFGEFEDTFGICDVVVQADLPKLLRVALRELGNHFGNIWSICIS